MALIFCSDEHRQELVEALGEEVGATLYLVECELLGLNYDYRWYRSLFGTSSERVEILNKAAGGIAAVIDEAMYDEVLSRIARLLDKESMRGKNNLSLKRLYMVCKKDQSIARDLVDSIKSQLDVIELEASNICFLRNKALSHNDLKYISEDSKGHGRPSRVEISHVIKLIEQLCNTIRLSKDMSECDYSLAGQKAHDSRFFFVLEKGLEILDTPEGLRDFLFWRG